MSDIFSKIAKDEHVKKQLSGMGARFNETGNPVKTGDTDKITGQIPAKDLKTVSKEIKKTKSFSIVKPKPVTLVKKTIPEVKVTKVEPKQEIVEVKKEEVVLEPTPEPTSEPIEEKVEVTEPEISTEEETKEN